MKVLLDTCIVLDMLLARVPWDVTALAIWTAGLRGRVECCITATTVTNIHYIGRRLAGADQALEFVATCLREVTILPVDAATLRDALALGSHDYEDAVQVACARQNRVDYIVTRDGGVGGLGFPVIAPDALLALLPGDEAAGPSATVGLSA